MPPSVNDLALLSERFSEFEARLLSVVRSRMETWMQVRTDPHDLIQEVFVAAAKRWKNGPERCSPTEFMWWYGITRNCLVDETRRQCADKRNVHCENALPSRASAILVNRLAESITTPSVKAVKNENVQKLQDAVETLNEQSRDILYMKYREKLSFVEIGRHLELSERQVRHLHDKTLDELSESL